MLVTIRIVPSPWALNRQRAADREKRIIFDIDVL